MKTLKKRKRLHSRKKTMKARSMKARSMRTRNARSMRGGDMKGNVMKLFSAVEKNDTDKVSELLEAGANPNWSLKATAPLHIAAKNGFYDLVDLLIDKKADLNILDAKRRTPLNIAAESGYLDIVELLLDNGADINKEDIQGYTPLNTAVAFLHEDIVDLLIDKGADLDKPTLDGTTPLITALKEENEDLALILINAGADVNVRTKDGNTPLIEASYFGNYTIVSYLLDHDADPNVANSSGETPLSVACASNDTDNISIVHILLNRNADPNMQENNGRTPLHIASENGSEDIVDLLLENNANPNIQNNDGETPLLIACKNGFDKIIVSLLEHNANPNIEDNNGETPLFVASKDGSLRRLTLLIKKRATITHKILNSLNEFTPEIQAYLRVIFKVSTDRTPLNSNSKPVNAPSKCFDPVMYSNTNISNEVATFYIQNEKNQTISTGCLDEDSLKSYKTMENYVFYRCKDSTPVSALYINPVSVNTDMYRLLNFDRRIYVKDVEFQQVEVGKQYILRPTGEPLGRIASRSVVLGGSAVSSNHCGPADGSIIYKLYQVGEGAVGGRRRKTRRYRGLRKKCVNNR